MNKPFLTLVLLFAWFITLAQPPAGLSSMGYRTTVHLKWDNYTAFTPAGYNIYRSTVSGSYGAPARRVGAYDNYTDYNLSPSTTYFYKISAFDAAGNESPLSQEITVSTNSNNYLKVANLDLFIPIYTGGMSASAPDEIKASLEHAREFYFRNTLGQLNLKYHYMVISGYPPFNSNGQADFGTIETDLKSRGILDNQYDAVYGMAMQLYGFFGGAWWLGQTAGSMGYDWTHYSSIDHYTQGNSWLFSHEFGHALDFVMANGSGYPEMLINHYGDNYPLPASVGVFDAGGNQDGMALILRLFQNHLNYQTPWNGYFEVVDNDHDGLADSDPRLIMDEVRFGSSPAAADSDGDGLNDLEEYHASTFSSANPNNPDTDGDGVVDGQDVYPVSNFNPINVKTKGTIAIDGVMSPGEGWQPMASKPFFSVIPGTTLNTFTTWDDENLYFTFQSNQQLKYFLQMDGSGENGIWESDIRFPGGDYSNVNENSFGDSYVESAELIIRSDGTQVYLKGVPVPGSQVATTFSNGVYTTEFRFAHNLGPGFGYTYSAPGSPVVTSQSYGEGDVIGIHLVGIPLSEANGYQATEWLGYYVNKSIVLLNDIQHFYDMTLTTQASSSYCASTSNFPWEEWIANVKVGTINNASGKSPYSDFTNLSTNLTTGNNPIELTTGFSYFTWDEYWRVWVDLNQDGDFDDVGEVVLEQIKTAPPAGTATNTLNSNIFISPSALTGPTRMRVSMKRGAYPTPCETLPFGEVEDYTVNIQQPAALPNLVIPNYEVIPANATCYAVPGQSFGYLGGIILNSGSANAGPFLLKVSFSKDNQHSTDDVPWQFFQYTGVAPNNVVSFSLSNPVPSSLAPGRYFVLLRVDAENEVTEVNENDNLIATQVNLGAPDFIVSNLAGVPASQTAGGSISLSATVANTSPFPLLELQGTLGLKVYLSADNQFSISSDVEIGTGTLAYNQFSNGPLYNGGIATTNLSAQLPAGTAAGNYFIFVVVSGGCEVSGANNVSSPASIQITTGQPGTYCTSFSNFPWEDWIANVKVGTVNNASGKSPYSNFTNLSTSLPTGNSPIELTTGFSYFTFDEYWRVWIDLNQDGDFTDAGEMVFSGIRNAPPAGTPTATITGGLNIPTTALTGSTRMRVSMKRGAYPTPCETLPFGEVEDYTVNISGTSGCSPDVTPPVIAACPGNISVSSATPLAVNWTPPTATDNCGTPTLTSTHQPGAIFPFGTTTVTYTAKDAANNMATCVFTVTVTQTPQNLPDLVLTNLQAQASGAAGAVVNFTFKLDNIGTAPAAGNYTIGCYLSTDNTWSSTDVLAGIVPTGNTPVNFNTTVPASITIPSGFAAGNYFLICVADKDFVIQESNENNNTVSAAFQVTGGGPVTYCGSFSSFPWEDWIAKVELANLSNPSGKSLYSDFTSLSANVQPGNSYPITLTSGFSYFTWDEYWRVWIDFNRDGVFSTPDEVVQQRILTAPAAGTPTASVTGSVSIPAWVTTGPTRMRVSMKRGAYASSCETLPFGEVEDYTVNVTSGGPGCNVQVSYSNVQCQDNNTPLNPLDDGFTFDLLALGSGTSANWLMTWNGGSTTGTFGVSKTVGPFSIATFQSVFNFTVADAAQPSCSATGSLIPPPPCSVPPAACGFTKTYQTGSYDNVVHAAQTSNGYKVIASKSLTAGLTFITLNTDQDGNQTGSFTEGVIDPFSYAPVWLRDGNYAFLSVITGNLIKLEKRTGSGTSLWSNTYTVPNVATILQLGAVYEAPNGELYITGEIDKTTTPGTVYELLMLKVNSGGTQQWLTTTVIGTPAGSFAPKIFNVRASGNAIVRLFFNDQTKYIAKVAGNGTLLWKANMGGFFTQVNDVAEGTDGNVLVGATQLPGGGPGNSTAVYTKLAAADGSVVWVRTGAQLGGDTPIQFPTYNSTFVAAATGGGYAVAFLFNGGLVITGVNPDGSVAWTKIHNFINQSTASTGYFTRTNDGGYLIAGTLANGLWLVKTDNQGNVCETPTPGQYCTSTSNFPWEDWIARVKVNTLDNSSGKSPYSDFTALSTNLQKGVDYTMALTTGFSYFTWDEYWKVWIDLNHDGVFQDPEEVVLTQILSAPANGTATASVTGAFKLSNTALNGPTRMRVSMKRGGNPGPCETLLFGEVEDYTVNIVNMLNSPELDNRAANLTFEAVREKTGVNLYGAFHFTEPVIQIEVEKSTDGLEYAVLETLQGKVTPGNSQVVQLRDAQPNDGFNFYRMLILLENGEEVYSPVRIVSFDMPLDFTIFPNPANSEVFIHLTETPDADMLWNINDAYGRVVWTQKIAPDTAYPYRLDVQALEPGMYYLFVMQPGRRTAVRRFVVVR